MTSRNSEGAKRQRESLVLTTAHHTIVAADIVGFGEHHRNNTNQVRLRRGLYGSMEHAFDTAGIHWNSCRHEDRGDGVLVLAPAVVPKTLFVDRLPRALLDALTAHNGNHPRAEQMRLRLALHAGEVMYDDHGVTSSSVTHTFRLLDSLVLKDSVAASSSVLAILASNWFFEEVVRHSEHSDATSYRPADIATKETATRAWVRLLGTFRL